MEHCVCVQERQAFDVRIQTARDKPNNKILERDKLINGTNLEVKISSTCSMLKPPVVT